MATASDKFNKNGRDGARILPIFSLFWTSIIHNQVNQCEQNFVCLKVGLSRLWWYVATTRVSIFRNCEGFEKCQKSHFWEIDKIRKIAVFWTILFSKVE